MQLTLSLICWVLPSKPNMLRLEYIDLKRVTCPLPAATGRAGLSALHPNLLSESFGIWFRSSRTLVQQHKNYLAVTALDKRD
eukprot:Nitzschia sp. Nitz4//scaffold703_size1614//307//627//NITZ4_009320-RA/size1614-exonerate_est2genome-gene-0.2-mRNA-1//1//CDS//3329557077//6268//frame0